LKKKLYWQLQEILTVQQTNVITSSFFFFLLFPFRVFRFLSLPFVPSSFFPWF